MLEEAEREITIVFRTSKGATKIIMKDASNPCKGIKRDVGETQALIENKKIHMTESL